MSRTIITPLKASEYNRVSAGVATSNLSKAVDEVEGAEILWDFADEKAIIMLQNTSSAVKAVTFVAGDSLQGTRDEVVSVEANETVIISIESGRFKHFDPKTDENKIIIKGEDATIKVACFVGA